LSHDYLGTTRLITDGNGKAISRHDYLPFGEEIPASTAGRGATPSPTRMRPLPLPRPSLLSRIKPSPRRMPPRFPRSSPDWKSPALPLPNPRRPPQPPRNPPPSLPRRLRRIPSLVSRSPALPRRKRKKKPSASPKDRTPKWWKRSSRA